MTQNYLFAHRILHQLVFSDPRTARQRLNDIRAVRQLWTHAGAHARQGEVQPSGVLRLDLTLATRTVIILPPPSVSPEAHFIAIDWAKEVPSYFVLELGDDLDGNPSNYLCGWDPEGNHSNYGDGYAADPCSFLAAIDRLPSAGL